jgi:hypothetical protein
MAFVQESLVGRISPAGWLPLGLCQRLGAGKEIPGALQKDFWACPGLRPGRAIRSISSAKSAFGDSPPIPHARSLSGSAEDACPAGRPLTPEDLLVWSVAFCVLGTRLPSEPLFC